MKSSAVIAKHSARPVLALMLIGLTLLSVYLWRRSAVHHQPGPVIAQQAVALTPDLTKPDQATQTRIKEAYGRLPLSFEVNQGQVDSQARFISRGHGYSLFLTPGEAALSLHRPAAPPSQKRPQSRRKPPSGQHEKNARAVLRLKLKGADPAPQITGLEPQPGRSNYFIGKDPLKWRTDVAHYARVQYSQVYPGIDLVYYGNQQQLEYDFIVAPGADPRRIRMSFDSLSRMAIDADGSLRLRTAAGEVRQHRPVIYQEVAGVRQTIAGRYAQTGRNEVGFAIEKYDPTLPLVIDPVLVYSTYLGGSSDDDGPFFTFGAIAVDAAGNAYVTGATNSTDFPTVAPFQPVNHGSGVFETGDAFVAKLNPAGTALIYSTFLGGLGDDIGQSIAIDGSGSAYVTGFTSSLDFPTRNAFQGAYGGGVIDCFVTKLNAAGNALVYSTYLGGSTTLSPNDGDQPNGIAVDGQGNAYITGFTQAGDFPVTPGAFQTTFHASTCDFGDLEACPEAFLTKINAAGTALVYSTLFGGGDEDIAWGLAVDAGGSAFITGYTSSTDLPTRNPIQPDNAGGGLDGFVARFNAAGSNLIYATYLGGSGPDSGNNIAADAAGHAYIVGTTSSSDFPTRNALQPHSGGGSGVNFFEDAFITKLNPLGTAIIWSTYLGGSGDESASGIRVDAAGHAYVTGQTTSSDFPTFRPVQAVYGGPPTGSIPGSSGDAFVVKLTANGRAFIYSTYLGGSEDEWGQSIGLDRFNNAYVTGFTRSPDYPVTPQAFQKTGATHNDNDAMIFRIADTPSGLRVCFRSPDWWQLYPGNIPNGSVIVGGANYNNPVSTDQTTTILLALRGGRSAAQQLNRGYVAAQLSVLAEGNNITALNSPLELSGAQFLPVTLSNGITLTSDSPLRDLLAQTRSAITENRTADMLALAAIFDQMNGGVLSGHCGN